MRSSLIPPPIDASGPPSLLHADSATAERVLQALRASGYPLEQHVRCTFHEGVLTLRGQVPSYFLKQMVQSAAARVPGVEVIVNHIEVT